VAYAEHVRFSMQGNLLSEAQPEIWQCTVNMAPANVSATDFDSATFLATLATDIGDWFSDSTTGMVNQATLNVLKCNAIGTNGKYIHEDVSTFYDFSPAVAGHNQPSMPDILMVGFRWTTARQRGPGSRGMIFMPNSTLGDGHHVTIGSDDQAAANTAARQLLSILASGVEAYQAHPCVSSKVDASNTAITGVSVSNIIDVQRRRKDALTPSYNVHAWP